MTWPAPILAPDPTEARGWMRHAVALAEFFGRWPVRFDVWGAYKRLEHREPGTQSSYTKPGKAKRGTVMLDAGTLRRHFIGATEGDVIGLHAVSPDGDDSVSRWFGLDFDAHGDVTTEYLESLRLAASWCAETIGERCSVLLEDSNGRGGYHLWAYFDAPLSSASLYVWLQSIATRCHEATGITPETYPKQPRVNPDEFGSWLRLPGRHHTRPHWSRVCRPGQPWCAGEDAAREILENFPATPADVIPPLSAWPAPVAAVVAPVVRSIATTIPTNRADRIARYLDKCPHGGAGTGRSDVAYTIACRLAFDFLCTESEALPLLNAWDAGNTPPLGARKIRETWENAGTYGARGGSRAA